MLSPVLSVQAYQQYREILQVKISQNWSRSRQRTRLDPTVRDGDGEGGSTPPWSREPVRTTDLPSDRDCLTRAVSREETREGREFSGEVQSR